MYVTHHYLIQFLILGVALASPPPQDGRGGVQVVRRVLLVVTRLAWPEVLRLLLHLDGPDLAVQRERGHTQALILLIAVKIIEIPAAIIMS